MKHIPKIKCTQNYKEDIIMDNKENKAYIESLVQKGRAAVEEISGYTQEQIDNMVQAISKASMACAMEVAQINLVETGMGNLQMLTGAASGAMLFYDGVKGQKSLGLIDEDPVTGLRTYAKPMGVLCCTAPSTTPVFNIVFVAINGLKSGNAVISCPHPNAKRCAVREVEILRDALVSVGAPADLLQVIEEPTLESSGLLMEACDAIIAVGGAAMVKAAYSKGKPCFGVGQGNVQTLMGKAYPNVDKMAKEIFESRIGSNGVPCTGEQTLWIHRDRHDEVFAAFQKLGADVISDKATIDKMRKTFFDEKGINRAIVGKRPKKALKAVGIEMEELNDSVQLLVVDLNSWGKDEPLAREIMFPILRVNMYDDFQEAARLARANLLIEGAGHSAGVWSQDEKEIDFAAATLPVGRLLVEQGGTNSTGSFFNGLPFTNAVGCGTWGGNSISENLTFKHLRNFTKVANLKNEGALMTTDFEKMMACD
ncbi:MAG: aldehyde dehydrogenase family protein [Oscillibacter sp.]